MDEEKVLYPHQAASNENEENEKLEIELIIMDDTDQEKLRSLEERTKKATKLLNAGAGQASCPIFRVPNIIKDHHPRSFEPDIVSIGPYYHGEERLEMMQEQKCRFLGVFLGHIETHDVVLEGHYEAIKEKEEQIRGCYSHNIEKYSSSELIEMMILDGCFIIHLLCVVGRIIVPNQDDPIFSFPWMLPSVTRDLLMLENQIPFIVLQTLYNKSISDDVQSGKNDLFSSRKDKTMDQIDNNSPDAVSNEETENPDKEITTDQGDSVMVVPENGQDSATGQGDSAVLLPENEQSSTRGGFVIRVFKKICQLVGVKVEEKVDTADIDLVQFIQPVEKLLQAGIKFKKREDTNSFLDIDFRDGALRMPLPVTGETMSTFILNCIAFEQCYKYGSKHFTSYFNFMGYLINTSFDAGYLREKKIIENFFGTDQELVNFFNELGKNVPYFFNKDYLMKVAEKVEIYYRSAWNVGFAEFKYKYFRSVWVCLSAFAALFVILLTALQTFYAVYAYQNP